METAYLKVSIDKVPGKSEYCMTDKNTGHQVCFHATSMRQAKEKVKLALHALARIKESPSW